MRFNLIIRKHYDILPTFQAFDQAYFAESLAPHDVLLTEIHILDDILTLSLMFAAVSTLSLVNKCDFAHSEKVLFIILEARGGEIGDAV